jgi:hypothetical protein
MELTGVEVAAESGAAATLPVLITPAERSPGKMADHRFQTGIAILPVHLVTKSNRVVWPAITGSIFLE